MKKTSSSSPKYKTLQREIDRIKTKIDRLNSKIWKCTEQYYNLKKQQQSDRRKISYRENKLKSIDPKSKKAKQYRSELRELKSEFRELEEKLFTGSDRYQNLGVNMEKLNRRIKYLQNQFMKKKELADSGATDKDGRPIKFETNDRMSMIEEIKNLGEKREALKEAIDQKKIKWIEHDRVEFFSDDENLIDGSEETIFSYKDEVDNSIRSGRYNEVIITGELIGTKSYSYPDQIISLTESVAEFDTEFAPYGSKVFVRITRDNQNKTLTIEFVLWDVEEN